MRQAHLGITREQLENLLNCYVGARDAADP
jgi:hypothetical protein